jgi:hypothetical protein
MVLQRGTAGRDKREPAAEADAHHPDALIAIQPRLGGEPDRGAFDRVGDRRGNLEARELGDVRRHDGDAAGGELVGQPRQPRLLDAGHVQPGGQERDPAAGIGVARRIDARAQRSPRCRNRDLPLLDGARIEIGQTPRRALQVRGADDERYAVRIRRRDQRCSRERHRDRQDRDGSPNHPPMLI